MLRNAARFRLDLRSVAVGLLMVAVLLNSALVVLTALHETTHRADARHAHVDHGDHSVPESVDEADGTVLLHMLMHAGQWAVTRRQLGRPPLF